MLISAGEVTHLMLSGMPEGFPSISLLDQASEGVHVTLHRTSKALRSFSLEAGQEQLMGIRGFLGFLLDTEVTSHEY